MILSQLAVQPGLHITLHPAGKILCLVKGGTICRNAHRPCGILSLPRFHDDSRQIDGRQLGRSLNQRINQEIQGGTVGPSFLRIRTAEAGQRIVPIGGMQKIVRFLGAQCRNTPQGIAQRFRKQPLLSGVPEQGVGKSPQVGAGNLLFKGGLPRVHSGCIKFPVDLSGRGFRIGAGFHIDHHGIIASTLFPKLADIGAFLNIAGIGAGTQDVSHKAVIMHSGKSCFSSEQGGDGIVQQHNALPLRNSLALKRLQNPCPHRLSDHVLNPDLLAETN